MKIIITTDSTCDLSPELIKKYNIKVLPLCVSLGSDEYYDGENISPKDIFSYVKKTKVLPKTAGRSIDDFKTFFQTYLDEGYDIVHIGISSGLSVCYNNCIKAKDELNSDKIHIVDGRSLSTGTGLLLLNACDLIEKGKSASQIADIEQRRANFVEASFIVDTLDYLHKGGRCSTLAMFGANLLNLKPKLQVVDSKLISNGKYRGKMVPVLKKYIDDILIKYDTPDKTRCFITHASAEPEVVKEIVDYVKAKKIFNEVIDTVANATITSHCGKGTLGILYINDGGKTN